MVSKGLRFIMWVYTSMLSGVARTQSTVLSTASTLGRERRNLSNEVWLPLALYCTAVVVTSLVAPPSPQPTSLLSGTHRTYDYKNKDMKSALYYYHPQIGMYYGVYHSRVYKETSFICMHNRGSTSINTEASLGNTLVRGQDTTHQHHYT